MSYGELKIDTITFTSAGVDASVSVSGLVQNPTFTGNITTTGTISGDVVRGNTVSGATVTGGAGEFGTITGNTAGFTTVTGTTVTGTTANFATVSGTTVTGNTANFVTLSGTTVTGATANFVTLSGTTVTGNTGQFTNITGVNIIGTTQVSGATVTGDVGRFTTITGGTHTLTSGVFASGTAANPSITFVGDLDTGLFTGAANTVSLTASGAAVLTVSGTNVGIGTSSPDQLLHISSGGNTRAKIATTSTAGFGQLYMGDENKFLIGYGSTHPNSADQLALRNNTGDIFFATGTVASTERLRIDSSGRVGLGTSSPGSYNANGDNLVVYDSGNSGITVATGSSTGFGTIYFADGTAGSAPYSGYLQYDHTNDKLYIGSGAATTITCDSSQRVGIGTTSPGSPLDVFGGAIRSTDSAGNARSRIEVFTNGQSNNQITLGQGFGAPTDNIGYLYNRANAALVFGTNDTERLRITSDGKVGLGTSSPGYLLSVAGRISYSGAIGEGADTTLSSSSTTLIVGDSATWQNLALKTNGNNRLYINSSGNVGVGTTLAGNSANKLSVRSDNANSIVDALLLNNGSVDNATGTGVRINFSGISETNSDIRYAYIESATASINNDHYIAFGTNSAATTPVERARIDSSGRLLVGTSTARSNFFNSTISAAFQVEGASSAGDPASRFIAQIYGRNNNDDPIYIFAKHRGTTVGANTVVSSDDNLGLVSFQGSDGSQFVEAAQIRVAVDGTPGANSMPGRLVFSTNSGSVGAFPTERVRITSGGNLEIAESGGSFGQALTLGYGSFPSIWRQGVNGSGIHFTTNATIPTDEDGSVSDNTESFGVSSYRWTEIFAANGTINTSDATEKQDIQDLSASELAVARELKGLFKTFRWKDAVAKKGDNARIHVGVIAQDVQELFANHGLDVTKYGLWCSDTWYEVDGMGIASNGTPYTADSEGAVAKTRLGIRYEELLAFVLAAL